jgi:predicted nucleic acid-binding Zn ribbon protein
MPTYVYETLPPGGQAGDRFEVRQGMTEAPLTHHPDSGVPVRRVLSGGLATFTTAGAATGAPGGTPMPMGGCGSGCGCAM